MTLFAKYGAGDLDKFVRDVEKYSIGMDEWLHRFGALHESQPNYPPYNLVKESSIEFRLDIALAGFKKEDIKVYTENNKLFVEGSQGDKDDVEYLHQGLAARDFTRVWTISDDVRIDNVDYVDGILSVKLRRIIPEHQKRQDWL